MVSTSNPVCIAVKRGDSFVLGCTATDAAGAPVNLATWGVRSQLRRQRQAEGQLIAEMVYAVVDAPAGTYTLSAPGDTTTAAWPIGWAELDIEYTQPPAPGATARRVVSTQTLLVDVLRDVTQPVG